MKNKLILFVLFLTFNQFAEAQKDIGPLGIQNSGKQFIIHQGYPSFLNLHLNNSFSQNKLQKTNGLVQLIDSVYWWSWDTAGNKWENDIFTKDLNFTYDSHKNLTGYKELGIFNHAWMDRLKYIAYFDSLNNIISSASYSFNGNQWLSLSKDIYTYDTVNNLLTQLSLEGNGTGWLNSLKFNYSYDMNHNCITDLMEAWNGTIWEIDHKFTYSYNSFNKKSKALYQIYNGQWQDKVLDTFYYNTSNNLIYELFRVWDGVSWNDSYRYKYTYDSYGNIITILKQRWNAVKWDDEERTIYAYDAFHNQISDASQFPIGSTWLNYYNNSAGYDANNFIRYRTHKDWLYTGKISIIIAGDSIHLFYHTGISGINRDLSFKEQIDISPNPFSTETSINFTNYISNGNIKIFDVYGKEVRSITFEGKQVVIQKNELKEGVYFFQIADDNKISSKKKIIIK